MCVVAVIVLDKRWIDGDTPLSLVSVEVKNPYALTSPLHPAS